MGKMAVSRVAAAYQNTVSSLLQRFKNKHRADSSCAGKADNAYIWRIFQPAGSRQISARIGAVGADKSNDFRFKRFTHQLTPVEKFSLFWIKGSFQRPITSAKICFSVKPAKSRLFERQKVTQVPQPWHKPGLTEATRLMIFPERSRMSFCSMALYGQASTQPQHPAQVASLLVATTGSRSSFSLLNSAST